MKKSPLHVMFLFLTYGNTYADSFNKLLPIYESISLRKRLIIIRNDNESLALSKIKNTIYEIGGDNTVFEFSGWQKGIEATPIGKFNPDIYILVNDSFAINGFYALPYINDEILNIIYENNYLGGHIGHLYSKQEYKRMQLNPYIQTHFFVLTHQIIKQLGSLISESDSSKFIAPFHSDSLFTDNNIWNNNLKRFIEIFLTQRWHGKGQGMSKETYSFFKRKILCLINEILLSARIKNLNYKLAELVPFSNYFNSFYTVKVPLYRPIRPYQFMRRIILELFYISNNIIHNKKTKDWFNKKCMMSVVKKLSKM